MHTYNGADGAYPGAPLPAGTSILAGYVGELGQAGAPDTPHIWVKDEWNEYLLRTPDLRPLPIYTHNYPGDPRECAQNAADAVRELGWRHRIGRLIVADLEELVDADYQNGLSAAIDAAGFTMLPYQPLWASQSVGWTGPVWAPMLTRHRPRELSGPLVGIQWRWGQDWDYDVFARSVYDRCGRGPRG